MAGLFAVCVPAQGKLVEADLLVAGGTESGWAAAIQAARQGVERIVLVNDIEWLGGQFSAEAVGAIDENRGVDNEVPFPRSGLFAELTGRIEQDNLRLYGHRRPGNSWTARTQVRPAQAARIFREMIDPYVRSGQIRIFSRYFPVSAALAGDGQTLDPVHFRSPRDGEPDLTVMRIVIDGEKDGREVRHTFNLLDYYNPDTETSSMARTTGYTCTAMVRLLARGLWTSPGLATPEIVGQNEACYRSVLEHLQERGVHVFHRVEER